MQPTAVRLARGESPVPLHRVIVKVMRGDLGQAERDLCSWVTDVPLGRTVIRSLVEACRDDLAELFRFLGQRTVVGYAGRARLKVHDTRRVLKICRQTDDPEVLRGASTVLVNATFGRIAEPALVAKLLAVAPSEQLVGRVFGRPGEYVERGAEGRGGSIALGQAVAPLILDDAHGFSAGVASRAAAFLAEIQGLKTTALFEERPDLFALPG